MIFVRPRTTIAGLYAITEMANIRGRVPCGAACYSPSLPKQERANSAGRSRGWLWRVRAWMSVHGQGRAVSGCGRGVSAVGWRSGGACWPAGLAGKACRWEARAHHKARSTNKLPHRGGGLNFLSASAAIGCGHWRGAVQIVFSLDEDRIRQGCGQFFGPMCARR
jgi:hypothetical protein